MALEFKLRMRSGDGCRIAHRLTTIRNASRVLVIEARQITESGTHAELMAARGHYYELYRQQSLQQSTQSLQPAALLS